jgi:hypothetical protein
LHSVMEAVADEWMSHAKAQAWWARSVFGVQFLLDQVTTELADPPGASVEARARLAWLREACCYRPLLAHCRTGMSEGEMQALVFAILALTPPLPAVVAAAVAAATAAAAQGGLGAPVSPIAPPRFFSDSPAAATGNSSSNGGPERSPSPPWLGGSIAPTSTRAPPAVLLELMNLLLVLLLALPATMVLTLLEPLGNAEIFVCQLAVPDEAIRVAAIRGLAVLAERGVHLAQRKREKLGFRDFFFFCVFFFFFFFFFSPQ